MIAHLDCTGRPEQHDCVVGLENCGAKGRVHAPPHVDCRVQNEGEQYWDGSRVVVFDLRSV